ncbi:MAG: hypothetical protein JXA20_17930 [Spirochaetes bacterium]|nr:hypothetical protein [Spirochaetota bacterium]
MRELEWEILWGAISNGDRLGKLLAYTADKVFESPEAREVHGALEIIRETGLTPSLPTIREILLGRDMEPDTVKGIIVGLLSAYPELNYDFLLNTLVTKRKKAAMIQYLTALSKDAAALEPAEIENKIYEYFQKGAQ